MSVDNDQGSRRWHHDGAVPKVLDGLDSLARRQCDVLSRAQLASLGADRQMISRRIRNRVWRSIGPRVVVLHRGALSREQRWWVGILHCELPPRPGAGTSTSTVDAPGTSLTTGTSSTANAEFDAPSVVLAGLTAAEAGGLTGFESTVVHVAVSHGREVGRLDDPAVSVRVHQTRRLRQDQVHPAQRPPRLRLPRAIIDSASAVAIEHPGRARAVIAAAVQQRLVRPGDLEQSASGRRTLPGKRLLLETIADATGGAHSLPELDFIRGLRLAGMPEPIHQRKLQRSDGTWYLDNDFGEFLVTVEVNGLQHYQQLLREADDFQRAVLQISGRIVVDLSSFAVRHQSAQSMLLTAEALLAHGWEPSATTAQVLAGYREQVNWDITLLQAS